MMTQPPGRTTHHDGDGCTGQARTITPDAADHIRYRAKRLITRAHLTAWPEAVIHGNWIADHYGPTGEYYLSTVLAEYVRHGEPVAPRLALTVGDGDLEAAALFEHMVSSRRLATSPLDQCGALEAVRLPLQTFALHLHVGDPHAARRQWMHVYTYGTTHNPLVPPAFAALLILWATRATFGTRHKTAQTAPLN